MKRWRQINAVGTAATALLAIVTGCAVPPTGERSTSPISTSSLPGATATNGGEPAATLSTVSPSPSTAPPSTAPSDPTPAATPPPVTLGPLRIDGLARVVADGLRVRSAPEVSAASERLQPLLGTGTMLFVIEGPVEGSGYDWYRIAPASFGNGRRPE